MIRNGSVQSALVQLLHEGSVSLPVLLFTEYARVGLSEREVILLIQIIIFQEKEHNFFPTVSELSVKMNLLDEEIINILQKLVRGGFINIEEVTQDGIRSERYSTTPLFQQLVASFIDRENESKVLDKELYKNIFQRFEQEFGRPLSPLECEALGQWIDVDGLSEELIEAALREASFCNKLNFRYIDRILLDWKQNNIKNPEEAIEHSRNFRQKRILYQSDIDKSTTFSFYNWVNQE